MGVIRLCLDRLTFLQGISILTVSDTLPSSLLVSQHLMPLQGTRERELNRAQGASGCVRAALTSVARQGTCTA